MIVSDTCKNACWYGIEPEKTDPNDVYRILAKQFGTKNVNDSEWKVTDSSFPQHGYVAINDNMVVGIYVFMDSKHITIGDFISAIGEPEYVLVASFPKNSGIPCYAWGLLYPKIGLEVHIEQPEINSTSSGGIGIVSESRSIIWIGIDKPWTVNEQKFDDNFYKFPSWNGLGDYCSNI